MMKVFPGEASGAGRPQVGPGQVEQAPGQLEISSRDGLLSLMNLSGGHQTRGAAQRWTAVH